MMPVEKNPIKIIYIARNKLLPMSVWLSYLIFIILLLIVTFAIPNEIITINYQVFSTTQFILISVSALAFILSMYMFGREVYSVEDFASFYWCLIIIFSILKMIIVVIIAQWLLELLRIIFLSLVVLAFVSTITLVIHNMNRVSNKIVQKSKELH